MLRDVLTFIDEDQDVQDNNNLEYFGIFQHQKTYKDYFQKGLAVHRYCTDVRIKTQSKPEDKLFEAHTDQVLKS